MTTDAAVESLLRRAADDWVHAPEVAWVAKSVGGAKTEAAIRDLSVELIRQVLQQGLMRIGDVTVEGFVDWTLPVTEAVKRVDREWAALGKPLMGDICWLAITEKGMKVAQQLPPEDEEEDDDDA